MRRLFFLGFLVLSASPAFPSHRVTVSQLEQTLTAFLARHRSDEEIARELGNLQLSERLTASSFDRIAAQLKLQPRTALALDLLADESAMLEPPRAELPGTVPPDLPTQQHILEAAHAYVLQTVPRLPNFFATRSTVRFDDSAQVMHPGEWPIRSGFHLVGSTTRTVTVRDGHEVTDAPANAPAAREQVMGLYSFGEFGPILARTLTDLARGKIQFNHWEDSPLGVVAVFRYSVPRHDSHYQVHFCCIVDREFQGSPSYRNRNLPRYHSNDPSPVENEGLKAYDATPAYHGSLSIDPVSGAIVRMTLDAELDADNPILRASTVVEYGRVVIGDESFICPVRSIAISAQHGTPSANGEPEGAPILSINETTFTQYHRLGSSARLLTASPLPSGTGPKDTTQWVAAASSPSTPQPDSAAQRSDTQPQPGQQLSSVAAADPAATGMEQPKSGSAPSSASAPSAPADTAASVPPPPVPASGPPSEEPSPEMSTTAANGIPDLPANTAPPQESAVSLRLTSRLVDVRLLAFDRKGRPVTDLKPEDLQVFDDGRKQEIHFFAPPSPDAADTAAPAGATAQQSIFSNRPQPEAAPTGGDPAPQNGTILLIDESHIAWDDLTYARSQMLKFLANLPAGERVGLYSMNSLGFRVLVELTTDHAAVASRLKSFLPTAQSMSQAQEEERRNRQQFATVHNVADLNSVNGNHGDVPDTDQPVDPELLTMGSNPARASLIILAQVARHLAAIPGHKNLVWASSDNVLADWQDQSVGPDKGPMSIDIHAVRIQEAMNDAHAAVYPLDVSQLEGGAITADLQHSNVQLQQAAAENAATAASAGAAGGSGSVAPSNRDTGIGRISAQMSQDLHPIRGEVRAIAEATGGRAIRRASDLDAALRSVVQDGRATYQLSFSPQGPADDRYHLITVKLAGHRGVTLRYRTGYLFAREPATLKERFQLAVLQPTEASGIGVTAHIAAEAGTPTLNLTIAAADLGMEQQAGRWMDKLDIFFIQRDDAGIHAQLDGQTLGLRLKPETYQKALGDGIPFQHPVKMGPGMASVRVLVVDENSGRMGSVTIPAAALQAK